MVVRRRITTPPPEQDLLVMGVRNKQIGVSITANCIRLAGDKNHVDRNILLRRFGGNRLIANRREKGITLFFIAQSSALNLQPQCLQTRALFRSKL